MAGLPVPAPGPGREAAARMQAARQVLAELSDRGRERVLDEVLRLGFVGPDALVALARAIAPADDKSVIA